MVRPAAWAGEGGLWSPVPVGPIVFALCSVSKTGEHITLHISARHGPGPPRENTSAWVAARAKRNEEKERKVTRPCTPTGSSQLTARIVLFVSPLVHIPYPAFA